MSVQPITVYREAGYLVRYEEVSDEDVAAARKTFSRFLYDDRACNRCENLHSRHNEICDNCDAFQGRRDFAKVVEINNRQYLSMPLGRRDDVRDFLLQRGLKPSLKPAFVDPANLRMSQPIKMLPHVKLRDWQIEATELASVAKVGVIKAPPRSGKTLWASSFIARLGCKALVLASQSDWLKQFRETFVGSETMPAFTDADPAKVKLCRKLSDFEEADVALCTVQQFMNPRGRELLKKIRRRFAIVITDECHLGIALQTARVVCQFASCYRFGLSGTPARKFDSSTKVIFDIFGPVIYSAKVEQLKPMVDILDTKLVFDLKDGDFARFVNRVEYDKKRLKMIAAEAIKRVKQGHHVLIPMLRTKSVDELVKLINAASDERIAAPFYGGLKTKVRDQTIQDARSGRIKVLAGNTRLLSTGTNIPIASCLIEAAVSSNLPNCEQRTARILTPMEGKPQPLIVYVLDDSRVMRTIRRTEYYGCVHKTFSPEIAQHARSRFNAWLAGEASELHQELQSAEPEDRLYI